MDDRTLQSIKQHLQDIDAQNRILKNIERARSEATVTIGRASELFGFTENQLRDWEVRGLVCPNKSPGGQRLYPLTELDRLAVIRELLDNKKFSPGDIPKDINHIWYAISPAGEVAPFSPPGDKIGQLPIDQRVDRSEHEVFWRYFISQVVRLTLLLICEEVPDSIAGLVLPLQPFSGAKINDPANLPDVGLSLVGWLSFSRAFYSFLDERPSFKYPTDFRILHLNEFGQASSDPFPYHPLIVIQRRAKSPLITPVLSETIYRLLLLVYNNASNWQPCFDVGLRDWVYQITDFSRMPDSTDPVFDGIMNMVIDLGGKNADGSNRWYFSSLFLPQDSTLPVQQQRLSVRAYSKDTPVKAKSLAASSAEPGLTFRAYQSGHVMYRRTVSPRDQILAYQDTEIETRSAMAIPLVSEFGIAIATLYVASRQNEAFTDADLRALRVITRTIEELLPTYRARQQLPGKLSDLLNLPRVVDLAFREFKSEDDFISDLESLLATIQLRDDIKPEKRPDQSVKTDAVISFIEVDIDNQADLAKKYGDLVARNLSKEVGLRIQGYLRLQSNPDYKQVYHVHSDRYYMKFSGMSLNEAVKFAQALRNELAGEYFIDAQRVVLGRPLSRENLLVLQNVTVRLGVQSFQYGKLKDLLGRYTKDAIAEVRGLIVNHADQFLKAGQAEGGNCVIAWRPDDPTRDFGPVPDLPYRTAT